MHTCSYKGDNWVTENTGDKVIFEKIKFKLS